MALDTCDAHDMCLDYARTGLVKLKHQLYYYNHNYKNLFCYLVIHTCRAAHHCDWTFNCFSYIDFNTRYCMGIVFHFVYNLNCEKLSNLNIGQMDTAENQMRTHIDPHIINVHMWISTDAIAMPFAHRVSGKLKTIHISCIS